MKTIHIDIESYSSVDLSGCGVYRYAASPDFQILIISYSVDAGPIQTVDLASGGAFPAEVYDALQDDSVLLYAHNANFERVCISAYFGECIEPDNWRCTMVMAAHLGLPLSLDAVGATLKLQTQKDKAGAALIKYFCVPCTPTALNGYRTRNLPKHDPERWRQFIEYNRRDVEVELAVYNKIKKHDLPPNEWAAYALDQRINDKGVLIDTAFVQAAIDVDEQSKLELLTELQHTTGLANPNSTQQMKEWLSCHGLQVDTLDRRAMRAIIQNASKDVKRVLELRSQLAKTSVAKYQAMLDRAGSDGRAKGLFQFYGAPRTGRFAGRSVQLQNLPNAKSPMELRDLVMKRDYNAIRSLTDSIPDTLSALIRTAIIAPPGRKLIVADYSAIEARVLSWVADETWRMQVFENDGRIYEANASRMFHIPLTEITKESPYRQKGKVAELACGYGGGATALKNMIINQGGAPDEFTEKELKGLVNDWRAANPKIVKLWKAVDNAALDVVHGKGRQAVDLQYLSFDYVSSMLRIRLPSGRRLHYPRPHIGKNRFGGECIQFEGLGVTKKWETIETFGAKLVENCIQAIARDILVEAMLRLNRAGLDIVAHVHDEAIFEASPGVSVDAVCKLMSEPPKWAAGLPLRVDGFETQYYKKA